ncbi:thermostable hemolysin [Halomonas sp. HP20-15]|uniref:thermostable hemolysin n=1 Tax=Halomonas sp. HP20-15 TaxID=3085901 RepID=UPI0029811782|nr:thermostable hemolysin [Halomonas sp. HP20-15]MDW5378783.1 thermostable hemolysin [Halomonas sp. HP20-15]
MCEPCSPHSITAALSSLAWREARAAERAELEAFIADGYAREHGAILTHFQPRLFGLWRGEELQAALGIRHAGRETLFLERYLDAPVERRLAEVLDDTVARDRVVEVGNLATLRRGLLRPLIVTLIETLIDEDMQWLTFTATTQVRNAFQRLGLEAWPLAEADPARLGRESADWGRYYANAPMVMGGDMRRAWRHLQACRTPTSTVLATLTAHERTSPDALLGRDDGPLLGFGHV